MSVIQPRVSIVIPVRNEARNLEIVLPRLPTVHQVVLVDGHSVDGSVETARRCRPGIETVNQTRTGKGNALACGFARVTGDIVIMFDADGSADPAEIPRFVAALTDGADFAKGSRFRPGGGSADITRLRRAGNAALNLVTNRLMRTRFTDLCYGYNAFWTRVLGVLDLPRVDRADRQWGDGFEVETLINCRVAAAGLRIAEVPSFERDRIHGESNLNTFKDGLRVLRTILAEHRRSRRPIPAGTQASADLDTMLAEPPRAGRLAYADAPAELDTVVE
jgi:glycosyltransferase involved in cell wall biosynthesis